jgi:hypothetical protein
LRHNEGLLDWKWLRHRNHTDTLLDTAASVVLVVVVVIIIIIIIPVVAAVVITSLDKIQAKA